MGEPRTGPRLLTVALRRSAAIRMRIDGVPVTDIRDELGYKSTGAVYQDIGRALAQYVGQPAAELREIEVLRMDAQLLRLSEMEARVRQVRDATHVTVNNGKVIYVPGPADDGTMIPLLDDEPVLRATAQLISIERQRADVQQRRAKLLGLNAPERIELLSLDQIDEAIAKLQAEMAAMDHADAGADHG